MQKDMEAQQGSTPPGDTTVYLHTSTQSNWVFHQQHLDIHKPAYLIDQSLEANSKALLFQIRRKDVRECVEWFVPYKNI